MLGCQMKSLIEELDSKMLTNEHSLIRGKGKALFLGQLNDIKSALDKGYNRLTIWKHLNQLGRMPVGYASFAAYVYKYITNKESQTENTTKIKEEPNNNPIRNTQIDYSVKSQSAYSYNSASDKETVKKYA